MKKTLIICAIAFFGASANGQFLTDISDTTQVKPWKGNPSEENPINFQFAIMADRTGGMRSGIFRAAVEKVNLLNPRFVLSVGDLIDGYTENEQLANDQWNEFDAIIDNLHMPFFYVAGNHDISNPFLQKKWEERYGNSYYHFLYNNVLFLCLNTEENGKLGLSQTQLQYFQTVLKNNDSAQWTFVFMHQPIWRYGKPAQSDFAVLEKALKGRGYTVFAGHEHHYRHTDRNDHDYIVLATTGGGSNLNQGLGEFDHITWVTVPQKGEPDIANVLIDGILPKDIVNDNDINPISQLRSNAWIDILPLISGNNDFREDSVTLSLRNKANQPLFVSIELEERDSISMIPPIFQAELPPDTVQEIQVALKSAEPISFAALDTARPVIKATGRYEQTTQGAIEVEKALPVVLDWEHRIERTTTKIKIDGDFTEWQSARWYDVKQPYLKEGWAWKGTNDGWFRFALRQDRRFTYIAIRVFDDKIIPIKSSLDEYGEHIIDASQNKFGEQIMIHLTPQQRIKRTYLLQYGFDDSYQLTPTIEPPLNGILTMSKKGQNGFSIEMAIPHKRFLNHRRFKLNIGIQDHDNPNNTKPSVLWWRPYGKNNSPLGIFDTN